MTPNRSLQNWFRWVTIPGSKQKSTELIPAELPYLVPNRSLQSWLRLSYNTWFQVEVFKIPNSHSETLQHPILQKMCIFFRNLKVLRTVRYRHKHNILGRWNLGMVFTAFLVIYSLHQADIFKILLLRSATFC